MKKRVVVVDDSKFLLKIIVPFMEDIGLEVVGVGHNGLEALKLFSQLKPDLITLDITMPMMDGEQALSTIIKAYPDAKILMMSAIRNNDQNRCLQNGASGFIEKPLKFQEPEFYNYAKEIIYEILEIE